MARLLLAVTLTLGACSSGAEVVADRFPIEITLTGGPVIAHVAERDQAPRLAVIDAMSPLTVLDVAEGEGPSRRGADLTLLGLLADGALVPRAHLALTVTELHACPAGPCVVGPDGSTEEIAAVIGADAFDSGAIRFDFAASQLTLFNDVAGEDSARGRLCEAVLARPFRGGGTLLLGGSEIGFPARRIAIGACLSYDTELDADLVSDRGSDLQLVMSTGVGPTILSQTAYQQWLLATDTPATALVDARVHLPSGPIDGQRAFVDRMALVGGDSEVRGPCRQVYAHHLLSVRDCTDGDDCPCPDGSSVCRIPAVVELAPVGGIEVLVVADDHPTLQALRAELRPETAEVDGILGTGTLLATSVDVDTPHSRVLVRCERSDGCQIRPELITPALRGLVQDCLARVVSLPSGGAWPGNR